MVNPRRRGMGLGFANKEPLPVMSGGSMPMGARPDPGTEGGFQDGRYRPQAEPEEDMDFASSEDAPPEEMGDGWSDEAREFRDQVEAETESGDLYEGVEAWKKKWLTRAAEMGIDPDEAMRVLDSIADLDQGA